MKGRGFRGGWDEKMCRMWFGLEIDVVGLPPLLEQLSRFSSDLEIYLFLHKGLEYVNGREMEFMIFFFYLIELPFITNGDSIKLKKFD